MKLNGRTNNKIHYNKKPKINQKYKQIKNKIQKPIKKLKHKKVLQMIIGNYNTSRLNSATKKSINNSVMKTVKEILQ